jgi:hypothetical protein
MMTTGGQYIDVTAAAKWYASLTNDWGTPSPAVTVSAPGVFTPVQPGTILIHVTYVTQIGTAPHTYAVDPSRPAVTLAPYLDGTVTELDGTTPIGGATVEIVSAGPEYGKSATTLDTNGAFAIYDVVMNVPYTVQASKAGYVTSVQTTPPITDNALGYPGPLSVSLRLARVPTS